MYFTHDYFTMASDKNQHLVAMAGLTKKHGIKNSVAVCPLEHDLIWSENNDFLDCSFGAEQKAEEMNKDLTILRTDLTFGPQTLFVHYLV